MRLSKKKKLALTEVHYDLFQPIKTSSIDIDSDLMDTLSENQTGILPSLSELYRMYDNFNSAYFGGRLPFTKILYSDRMLIAGTFTPVKNEIKIGRKYHKIFSDEIEDTLKHEMIHIVNPRHDAGFKKLAANIGASLKAKAHPMLRGKYKYLYVCPACGMEYPRRKRFRMAYCGVCSKNCGINSKYKLILSKSEK